MFVFNKNYEELMTRKKYLRMKEYFKDGTNSLENDDESERYKVFTMEFIIKKVIDFSLEKTE